VVEGVVEGVTIQTVFPTTIRQALLEPPMVDTVKAKGQVTVPVVVVVVVAKMAVPAGSLAMVTTALILEKMVTV
jgi:hypothetical protein